MNVYWPVCLNDHVSPIFDPDHDLFNLETLGRLPIFGYAIRSLSRTGHAIYHEGRLAREDALTIIPKILHEHINNSYPAHVCLIGTVLPNGYAQITPRGSTMVFDDEHLALWERGRGSTNANLADGSKVTVFFRKPPLRESGLLPRGGIARFYGTAKIYKSGPIYEEIWKRLIEPEKKGDPEKKGFGVLINVERVEDLSGAPLVI